MMWKKWHFFHAGLLLLAFLCLFNPFAHATSHEGVLKLEQGNNFISLPVNVADRHPETLFADIYDKLVAVRYFDGEAQTWLNYVPGRSGANTLNEIPPGAAVLVEVSADVEFSLPGTLLEEVDYRFGPGWNMFGVSQDASVEQFAEASQALIVEKDPVFVPEKEQLRQLQYSELLQTGRGYWANTDLDGNGSTSIADHKKRRERELRAKNNSAPKISSAEKSLEQLLLENAPELNKNDYPHRGEDICLGYQPFFRTGQWSEDCFRITEVYYKTDDTNQPSSGIGVLTELPQQLQGMLDMPDKVAVEIAYKFDPERKQAMPLYAYARQVEKVKLGYGENSRALEAVDELMIFKDGTLEAEVVTAPAEVDRGPEVFLNLSWLHPNNEKFIARLAMDDIDTVQNNLLLTLFLGDDSSANQVWSKTGGEIVFNSNSGKDWLIRVPGTAKNIFSLAVSDEVMAAAVEDPTRWLPAELSRNEKQNETHLLEFSAPVANAWAMQGIFSPALSVVEEVRERDEPGLPICEGGSCGVTVNQDGAFKMQHSPVGFANGMLTFSGGPFQARIKGFDLLPEPQIGVADQVSSVALQWNPRVELLVQADQGRFKDSRLLVGVEARGIANLTSGELGKHFKACVSKPDLKGDDASRIIEIFANKQQSTSEKSPGCKGLFRELSRKDAHGGALAANVDGLLKGDFDQVDMEMGISIALEKVAVPSSNPSEKLRDSNIRGDLDLLVELADTVEFHFQNVQEMSRTQVLNSQSGEAIFEDTELVETVRGSGSVTFPQDWSLVGGVQIGAELFAELGYEKIAVPGDGKKTGSQEYRCTVSPLLRGYANLESITLGQSGWRLSSSDLLTIEYEDFSYNTKYSMLPNVGFIKQMKRRFSKGINRITTSVEVIPPGDLALSGGGVGVGQLDGILILERDVWEGDDSKIESSKWRWTVLVDCDLQLGDKVTVRQFVLTSDPDSDQISVSLSGDMELGEGSTTSIRGAVVIKRNEAGQFAGYALSVMGQNIRFGDSGFAIDDAMIAYETTKGEAGGKASKEMTISGRTLLDLHAMFPNTFPEGAKFNGIATYSSDGMLQIGVTELGMGGQGIIRSALRLDKDLPVEVMGIRNLIFTKMGAEKSLDVEVDILFEKLVDENRHGDNRAEWPVFTLGAKLSTSGWQIRGENLLVEFGKKDDITRVNLASMHLGKGEDNSWQAGGTLEFDLPPKASGSLKNIGIKSLPTHYNASYEYSAAGFLFSAAIDPAPEINLIGKDVKLGITSISCSKASPWAIALDSHAEIQGEKLNGKIAFGQGALKFQAPASAVVELPVIPDHLDLKISNFEIGFGTELGIAGKVKVRTTKSSSLRGMLGEEFEADLIASKTSLSFKTDTNINTSLDLGAMGKAEVNIRSVAIETDGTLSGAGKISIDDRSVDLVFGQTPAGTYFTADFGASGVDVDLMPVFQMALKNKLGIESMMAFQVLRIDDAYIEAGIPKIAGVTASTKNFKYVLPPGITPVGMPFFDDLQTNIMLVGFEINAGVQFPMPQKSELETTLRAFVEVMNPTSVKPWDQTEAELLKLNAPRMSVYDVYLQFPLAAGYAWDDQRNSMAYTDNLFKSMFGTDRLTFVERYDVRPVDLVGIAKAANVKGIIQKVMPADLRRGNYNIDMMGFKAGIDYELRDAVVPVHQAEIAQLPKLYDFSRRIGHVYQQLEAEEKGSAEGMVNVYPLTAESFTNRPELYAEKEFAYRLKFRKNPETRQRIERYLTVKGKDAREAIVRRRSALLNKKEKLAGELTLASAPLEKFIAEKKEEILAIQKDHEAPVYREVWNYFTRGAGQTADTIDWEKGAQIDKVNQKIADEKAAHEKEYKHLYDGLSQIESALDELRREESGLYRQRTVTEDDPRLRWLIQKGFNGNPEYQVYLDSGGRIRAEVYTLENGRSRFICVGSTVVSNEQEHDLGFSVDLERGKIRMHLDGRLEKECAIKGTKLAQERGGLYFGQRAHQEASTSLNGTISAVKYYDRDVLARPDLKEYAREFKYDNFQFIADSIKEGKIESPLAFPLSGEFTHKGRFRSDKQSIAEPRALLKMADPKTGKAYAVRYLPDGSLKVFDYLGAKRQARLNTCQTPPGLIGRDKSHSYAVAYNSEQNTLRILVDGFERARCAASFSRPFTPEYAEIGAESLYSEIYDKDLYHIEPNKVETRTVAMPAELGGGEAKVKTEPLDVVSDLNALDNLLQFLQSKSVEERQFEKYFHSLKSKVGKPRPEGNRLHFSYPGLKSLDLIVKGTYSAYDVTELKYDEEERLLLARYGDARLYQILSFSGSKQKVLKEDVEYDELELVRSVKVEGRGRIKLTDMIGRTFDIKKSLSHVPGAMIPVKKAQVFFNFGYEAVSDWQIEAVTQNGIKLVYDAGGVGIYSPDGVKVFHKLPGSRLHKVLTQLNEQVQKHDYQKLENDPERFMRNFWEKVFEKNHDKLVYKESSLSYLDEEEIGYTFAPLKFKPFTGEPITVTGIKESKESGKLRLRFGKVTAYSGSNLEGESIPLFNDLPNLKGTPFAEGIGSLKLEDGAQAKIYSRPNYQGWKRIGSWSLRDKTIKTPEEWKDYYFDTGRCLKNKHNKRHMSWGPYEEISAGDYLATIKYKRNAYPSGLSEINSNKFFEFDVYAKERLGSTWRSYNGTSTEYKVRAVPFNTDKTVKVELRTKNSGEFTGRIGNGEPALCVDNYSLYQQVPVDGYLLKESLQDTAELFRKRENLARMQNQTVNAQSIRLFNDHPVTSISDWTITLSFPDGVDLLYQNLNNKQSISINMSETRNRLSLNKQYGKTFVVAADKDGNVYPDEGYRLLVNGKEIRIASLADAASFIRLESKRVTLPNGQQATLNISGGINATVDKVAVAPVVEYAKTSSFEVMADNGAPYRFKVSPDGRGYDNAEKSTTGQRRQIVWKNGEPVAVSVEGGKEIEGGFFANAHISAGVSQAVQLNLNLSGQIKDSGGFYFDGKGNLIIANYELADAEIILSSETGLDIRGKLDVFGVGKAEVTGYIRPNGDFSLKGAVKIGIGSGKFTGIKGNAVLTNNPSMMLGVYGAAYAAGHKLVSGALEIKDGRIYFGMAVSVGIAGVDGKVWLVMKDGPGFGYDLRAYLKFSVPVVIWAPQSYDCKNTWLGRICLPQDWGWKQISTINVNADAHVGPTEIKVNKIPIDFIAGRLIFDVPTRKMNVEWK